MCWTRNFAPVERERERETKQRPQAQEHIDVVR